MVSTGKHKPWWHIGRWFLPAPGGVSVLEQPALFRLGRWACYGFALGAVALALLATYVIEPLREQPPALLFFVAVIVTSWYAGLRAGFAATVLSILALNLVFLDPTFSFQMEIVEDGTDFVAFAAAAWLVTTFQDRWRQTHRRLVAVQHEVQIARSIQQRFFPAAAPSVFGFDIGGGCFPAGDMGGDFFDYFAMSSERLGIAVGDVSGHGLGPAILMVLLRAYLRALALTCSDLEELLTRANRLLLEDTEDEWFATVFLVQLDTRSATFCFASAGHECYLLDATGETIKLESTGMPLGLNADEKITQSSPVPLRPGELLILLSDGIVESHSARGESFGLARAVETVRAHREESAKEIVAAIHDAARAHRGNLAQEDDMTIVIVKAM
jgi:hypothetical protein